MNKQYYVADFETTVYDGQTRTDVWASAVTKMFEDGERVEIFHSIGDTFDYFKSLDTNLVVYYHNLKFDGTFWVNYLLAEKGYKLALETDFKRNEQGQIVEYDTDTFLPDKYMLANTLKCSISDMGQWYSIKFKIGKRRIELRDSLKLLPFKVSEIGKAFKTKHQKLEMEYTGFRYPGCPISDKEKEYIKNDVLVVREALEFMFNSGHDKLTIGSCCLHEYMMEWTKEQYEHLFPNLYEEEIPEEYGYPNAGEYVRRSYRGGWCYLAKGKAHKIYKGGTTADVNSLYPSMMSSESGNRYPVGKPTFWKGNTKDLNDLKRLGYYYFIRVKTRFYLKEGKLPFIQIKNDLRYDGKESLETSDYYDPVTKKYYKHYYTGEDSEHLVLKEAIVTMTLTMTDYELIKEHYDLVDFEILDGCYFETQIGIFDEYIDKYKKIKLESKGAMRTLAKLFLNNLYGKMASSTNSSYKIPFVKPDKSIGLRDVKANDKKPGYIPVGSAITSYARNFTIRAAQKNYHGVDKPGFIYADTDSIHCDLPKEDITGITVHDRNFCCWKLESCWDEAIFARQKTYVEHIVEEDEEPIDTPYYNIKCAGMPSFCKGLFAMSLEGYDTTESDIVKNLKLLELYGLSEDTVFTDDQKAVINQKYTLEDFNIGLTIPGKLMPKRIPGGVLLVETSYKMR